jgi:adenosylhomocysteine nucleosidase
VTATPDCAHRSRAASGPDGVERIAVLAAMARELAPIVRRFALRADVAGACRVYRGRAGANELAATVTSIGTRAAKRVTEQLLGSAAFDRVVVIGIAGGIDPELEIGDLICPEAAVLEETGQVVRPEPLEGRVPRGRLLTTDVLYDEPRALERLRADGYVAVDMETAAIGAVAEARGIPWTAFRAISDFAGDAGVDREIAGLSRPDGTADPVAVVRFLSTRPWRIPKLVALARGTRRAVRSSTRAAIEALR